MLLAATVLAGTASAFAPPNSARLSSRLYEDAAAVDAAAVEAVAEVPEVAAEVPFCRGYVGGEGPEPIPFAGIDQSSVNWDPLDFAGVSACHHSWKLLHIVTFPNGETESWA